MLRIIQNRSANSAKSYYSHAEYYGESQELTGTWHGKAAEMLGLTGEISQCDFDAMCDNLHPRTCEPLTARTNRDRTVGYDFNFHVPKGVSLAYAFGDERIGDFFARAVNETMEEIEAEAKTRVRTSGRQEERLTSNLAWGTFIHKTARPVEGEADCHLHAHCFVFNATHDVEEDRFKAVQFRDLKRDAGYFEARFHARFAKALKNELGYDIRRQGRQWDIAAIPESMVRKFSRRTEQIERVADARGDLSAEDKANIAAETRESKNKHQSMEELREIWRNRLSEGEQTLIDSLPEHRSRGQAAVLGDGPASVEEAVKQAVLHCFERDAVVPYRKVLAEAMRVGVANLDIDDVAAEASRQGVIAREVDGRVLATTRDVLREENKVLEFARQGRHASTAMNPNWQIERDWMSDEQKEAIQTLIHSEDRVQLILGGAGTGKTTLMSEAVAAIEAGGHEVFTFAPSARASRDVLRNEGFENATTVAELLVSDELKNAVAGNVIWIDEAGLLGSRQLKQVFDIAEQGGARVILSGDWKRQHGSVDRGGVLGLLDRYAGVTPIQVNTIRRQQGRYKEAINSMSEGDLLRGFDQLDELGWVHEIEDEDRDQRIAGDFADVVENKGSALVISPTHRQAEHLTDAIRAELRTRNLLTGEDHQAFALEPLHFTEGERSDPAFYRPGDVIVFHQNAKGFKKGERWEVDGPVPKGIVAQANRFAVFRPKTIPLAIGDQLRITAGGKTKDGEHRLNNGSVYTVGDIRKNGDIELANGWVLDSQFGHLANGFVTTSVSSQGQTVDHVFIAEAAESFPAASSEQMYVSASRGRKSAQIYTDQKEALRDAIQQSSSKMAASELAWADADLAYQQYRRQQMAAKKEREVEREEAITPELVV